MASPSKDENPRNWAELPPELISSILLRLSVVDILENIQKVCRSWRRISKDPSIWRKIEFRNFIWKRRRHWILCPHAIDRSQGGLLEIDIWDIGTNKLLNYIANSSSSLRTLRIAFSYSISDKGFMQAIVKLPLIEDLEISYCSLSADSLKVAGQSCPNLKILKFNRGRRMESDDDVFDNEDAIAIAESMPQLCHLQLFRNSLTNRGLNAILESCPRMEHLDLRKCFKIKLVGNLEKRCLEKIRDLRRPHDSIADYPFGDL